MKFRDRKTLVSDLFFPNLLIIIGLLFSKSNLFVDGPPRNLLPGGFYESNPIYYNSKSSKLNGSQISDFINDFVRSTNT